MSMANSALCMRDDSQNNRICMVTVHRQAFSELKMPYDTVVVADFADLECEASAKSVTGTRYE